MFLNVIFFLHETTMIEKYVNMKKKLVEMEILWDVLE